MNDPVLTLAYQASLMLSSAVQSGKSFSEKPPVEKYFSRLGLTARGAPDVGGQNSTIHAGTTSNASKIVIPDIETISIEINSSLSLTEKIELLLHLNDCLCAFHEEPGFYDMLSELHRRLGIDTLLAERFRKFFEEQDPLAVAGGEFLVLAPPESGLDEALEGKWIEDNAPRNERIVKWQDLELLRSHLLVMFVEQIRSYVVRCFDHPGSDRLFADEPNCRFRILQPGQEIALGGTPLLGYSDLKSKYQQQSKRAELYLSADDVQCLPGQGRTVIRSFTCREQTGQLIGIVGREGVGKSTLLKLLAGKLKPDRGSILINGHDLWSNKYLLKGIIGYVPEEDLLLEELTVGENLSLTARLFYSSLGSKEIDAKVNQILSRLDLLELKHTHVGSILHKHIQPGQRRLINIALELLREPQILLVDNALSGLGMTDSAKVIRVLHDYSFSGNLVITSISQADGDTFRCFDKIWVMDEGGRAVYTGQVRETAVYLHHNLNLVFNESKSIDPSQLIELVAYKLPDPDSRVWKRVKEPSDWHELFIRRHALDVPLDSGKKVLPARILKIPNLEVQLWIFSIRNFKCKFTRIYDILRALLAGPFIALLIGLVLRWNPGNDYQFSVNGNIPLYLFLSTVIAFFLGLILSADEITRERNILDKEEYLEFSRFSYINSKMMYLFPVVALQTLLYVITANVLLGIYSFFWYYWFLLFSVACFGIMLGLVLSANVSGPGRIYKRYIPFIMAFQLIMGGGIIPYDKLNLGQGRYSPILADLSVARWGYEALAVKQYRDNPFERLFYPLDKRISQASYYAFHLVPELEKSLNAAISTGSPDSASIHSLLLQTELVKLATDSEIFPFEGLGRLSDLPVDEQLQEETRDYLTYINLHFYEQFASLSEQRNARLKQIRDSIGNDRMEQLESKYNNGGLARLLVNDAAIPTHKIVKNEIVRLSGTVFHEPVSNFGRGGLFIPMKMFSGRKTDTIWFNLSVIWLFSAVCYILLLFNLVYIFKYFRPNAHLR